MVNKWLLACFKSLIFSKPRTINLLLSQIDGGAFFIKSLLIELFFFLKSFYKVRRFFIDNSLSNNYPHRLMFSLQLLSKIKDFFIDNTF